MSNLPAIPGVSGHARDRMVERMGRDLTRTEWRKLVLDIIERRAVLVRSGGHGADLYAVTVGPVVVQAWWSPDTGAVKTILSVADGAGGMAGHHYATNRLRTAPRPAQAAKWRYRQEAED